MFKSLHPLFILLILFGNTTFGQNIGLAKSAEQFGREVTYTINIESFSSDTLRFVQVNDDLDAVFGMGNYSISSAPSVTGSLCANSSFDGSSDTELLVNNSGCFLPIGGTAQIVFQVQINNVTDQGSGLGMYSNQASGVGRLVTATSDVDDLSGWGTDSDPNGNDNPNEAGENDPTLIDVTQNPIIGLAKSASLNGNEVTFSFYLENFGNRNLEEVRITDNLDAAFGVGNYSVTSAPSFFDDPGTLTLNAGFDGSADNSLISSGTLVIAETAGIQITLDVTNVSDQGNGLGIYENQATITAQSPTRKLVEDLSDDGTDPDPNGNGNPREEGEDDPTLITIGQEPVIGVAKNVTVSGDSVVFDIYLENLGNTVLSNLSLTENLKSVFGAGNFNIRTTRILDVSSTLVLNPSFNENSIFEVLGTSTLDIGALDTIQIVVENVILSDQGLGLGNYENQVFVSGSSPSGSTTNDYSDNGTDPDPNGNGNPKDAGEDDKTTFSISANPKIGIALEYRLVGFSGTFPNVELIYHLENLGNEPLSNITIAQDLDAVYGAGNYFHQQDPTLVSGSSSLNFNTSFNGSTNTALLNGGSTLAAGESVSFKIGHLITTITDQGSGLGIYSAQVTVNSTSPNSTPITDLSDEGTMPDSNGNGEASEAGENDVTNIDVTSIPSLGIALDASVIGDEVTLDIYLENLGDLSFSELSVSANLESVFGSGNYSISTPSFIDDPGTITINSTYDGGVEDSQLLALSSSTLSTSETAQIRIIATIDTVENVGGLGLGNYQAQFTVSGKHTYGGSNEDLSDSGTDSDPNGNDDATESGENDATTFSISAQAVGIAQETSVAGDIVTIDLYLENFASETLSSISLLQGLDAVFGESNYSITAAPSLIADPGTLVLNGAFDGSSVTDVLSSSSTLGVGATAQIRLSVQVLNESDQGSGFGVYSSQASVYATNSAGVVISDLSDDGTDSDPNGNSDPSEAGEEDASSVIIVGNPSIGIAKHAVVEGTKVLMYFTIENLGNSTLKNVLVRDALNPVFGSGNYSIASQPSLVSGPATLTLFSSYFGFSVFDVIVGSGYIRPGEKVVIKTEVNVTNVSDVGNGSGVYHNGVTITSQDPAGNSIGDDSDAGYETDSTGNGSAGDAGENDVTVIKIGDEANIGIALDADVTGTEVTFDYYLENFGGSTLNDFDLKNDLNEVFGAGNYSIVSAPAFVQDPGTITLNGSFDGSASTNIISSGSSLAALGTAQIRLKANVNTLIDKGNGNGKYSNQVSVSATAPLGSYTYDLSDSGIEPDSTLNDFPADEGEADPTVFTVNFSSIGLAQVAIVDCEAIVTLNYYVNNLGTSQLDSVGLEQNLDDIFGSGQYQIVETPTFQTEERGLVLNEGYNGSSDVQILSPTSTITAVGAGSEIVSLKVKVLNPTLTTYKSRARLTATDDADGQLLDFSDAGTNPDANGNSLANEVGENDSTIINIYAPVVATVSSKTNVSCNAGSDGAVDLTVTGGNANSYSYSWSNDSTSQDLSGLVAGTYSVTVTDANSCTATASVTITEPVVLVASITGTTNVSCNGIADGTINLSVTGGTILTGGTTNYNYSWSNSATTEDVAGLAAGTYSVTVTDANSCTATASVIITEPAVLAASINSQTNVNCNGLSDGSATVNVTGGTAAYSYSWSSGGSLATASSLSAGTYSVTVTDANGCTATASVAITEPAVLTASVDNQTNVSCNGLSDGSATVSVSGGTTNYSYSWSPSGGSNAMASGLSAGTYTVTVTDANSCTATASVAITEPDVLAASINSQSNVSCNGLSDGSATVDVSGGTTSYSYSWSPSGGINAMASGLSANTYTVTVTDANSCTATASVAITEPAVLAASINSQTNVSCNGLSDGSATVSASGGTTNYSYSWSPSGGSLSTASGLSAGNYTVTVTDFNGCMATTSVNITEPNVLVASITDSSNVSCNGVADGTINLGVTGGTMLSGGASYNYSWNNSATTEDITGLIAGTYSVTVTDANGCTATASVAITEPAVLTASVDNQTNVSCNGLSDGSATVSVSGGTISYSYSWSPSGGSNAIASGLSAGTYTVTVTDANSCTATASVAITEPAVLTASVDNQTNVSCNGLSDGSATVSVSGGTINYSYSWSPSGGSNATASGLSAGTYTVSVIDANSCTATASVAITEPAVLAASINSQTNVSCNGLSDGSATVSASGGTTNYSYSWSPSGGSLSTASGLSAGNYTVTVTDANGCMATTSVNITEPNVLVASITDSSNVSCNGVADGTINLGVTGGTMLSGGASYNYSWNNSATTEDITGLIAGTYSVTVTDANGCTATASVAITEPAVLIASVDNQTNVSCNGGSNGVIDLNVSGGTTNYTYSWSNASTTQDISGLTAGTYSVTVTDANSCTVSVSVTITEPPLPTLSLVSSSNPMACTAQDGSMTFNTVNVTDGSYTLNYNYEGDALSRDVDLASNGFSLVNLPSGTYHSFSLGFGVCPVSLVQTIELIGPAFQTTASNTGPYEKGEEIQLMIASGVGFSWTGPNGFYSSIQSPTIDPAKEENAGHYEAIVRGANNCIDTVSTDVVVNCLPASISYYITYSGPGQEPEVISELTENLKVQINPNRPITVLAYPNCAVNNIESMKLSLSGTTNLQYHEDNEEIYALHDGPGYIGGDYLTENLYTFIGTAYDQDNVMGNEIIGPDAIQFYMVPGERTIAEPMLSKTLFCNGESFVINVDSVGDFVAGNLFKVYLSDKNGSFLKPRQIGFSNNPNQINCKLPFDLLSGTGYKIKVSSSDPVVTSMVSSTSLNIIGKDLTLVSSQDDILGTNTASYAVESIKASNDIKNNGNVEFNAGKNIQLEPGFEVESGSVFKAELKSLCPN